MINYIRFCAYVIIALFATQSKCSKHVNGFVPYCISSYLGVSVGFISKICRKHCPDITKSSGGCPSNISPSNLHHIMHLMERGKIENATQGTQVLKNILNHS